MGKCRPSSIGLAALLVAATLSLAPARGLGDDAGEVDFGRDVLPILTDNCFACHGRDANHRKAKMRLDERAAAIVALDNGHTPIVPGDPDNSAIIERITTTDLDILMPPPDLGKQITPKQIETLRNWIEQGADYQAHWSFIKPERPKIPMVKRNDWVRNPIDAFILARLEKGGLAPSPAADKTTLIRRLTLDLTGLPPTGEEIEDFFADDSPNAYEKVVDRLLASPQYGERMAWPWLDAARYADTNGYQGDPTRNMWPWRDWVVDALNNNMPFDQFTREQLAGDQFKDPTPEQRLATAFNRNHMINGEGGRIAEETRVENVFDRVETTATVWMGLTMNCARCHDHKFDPISMRDYFAMYDFFNQTSEPGPRGGATPPTMVYIHPDDRAKLAAMDEEIQSLEKQFGAPNAEVDAKQSVWETERLARGEMWRVLEPTSLQSEGGATLTKLEDGSVRAGGKHPDTDVYEFKATISDIELTAVRLEALVDPQSPAKSNGRDKDGNFVLSEIELFSRPANDANSEPTRLRFARATADIEQRGLPIAKAIDGKVDANGGWASDGHRVKKNQAARLFFAKPIGIEDATELTFRLHFKHRAKGHQLARFRLAATDLSAVEIENDDYLAALTKPADKRTPAEAAKVRDHYRKHYSELHQSLAKELDSKRGERKRFSDQLNGRRVMVMDTLASPRDTFMLVKGLYNQKTDEKVTANVPGALPPLPEDVPHNRLALANWILSPEHPLTARVTVNRYWQTFFGKGIVTTPEDFGIQGALPSHPKLLDWLAVEFVAAGWDVKHMHKLIVMSATYRQSSRVTDELLERDPQNVLLARAPRYRLPSWMLRDQALASSGLAVTTMGGPPVKPYQPPGVWSEATFGKIRYQADTGDKLYRRSLYTFWRRIVGPTMFFDVARRQTCEVKPARTNTPLHALTTLNDTTYVEAARALAQTAMQTEKTATGRIAFAFKRLTSRPPTDKETQLLAARLAKLTEDYRSDAAAAVALLKVGASKRDASLDVAEHAAYTALLNMMMNLDEVLCKP